MTQVWENVPSSTSGGALGQPPETTIQHYDSYGIAPEVKSTEIAPLTDVDPVAVMTSALQITRARKVAAEQREYAEQVQAATDAYETLGAVVDLLKEAGYPGADIVNVYSPGRQTTNGLVEAALWPLGIADDEVIEQEKYRFGADENYYKLVGSMPDSTRYYRLIKLHDPVYLGCAKEIRQAIDRFDIPVADDLLQ